MTSLNARYLVCLFLCLPFFASAQADLEARRNGIKLNLLGLTARNIGVQYERALGRKTSLALGLRVEPRGKVPLKGILQDRYGQFPLANDFLENSRLSNVAVTPEFRYYLGKRPQNGIYLAPYLRYAHFAISWNYNFIDNDGRPRPFEFSGNANLYSAGMMAGAQWHLGSRWLIDLWVAGISYGRMQTELNAVLDMSDWDRDDKVKLELLIEGTTINDDKLSAEIGENTVRATGSFKTPGIRTGICIGFVF